MTERHLNFLQAEDEVRDIMNSDVISAKRRRYCAAWIIVSVRALIRILDITPNEAHHF